MPKIFVLPTQEDVSGFQAGNNPENIVVREFITEAELDAYKQGIDIIEDEFDELEGLNVVGTKVCFTRSTDEVDDADIEEMIFSTAAEAEACRQGIDDSEGFRCPMIIEESDAEFSALVALLGQDHGSRRHRPTGM